MINNKPTREHILEIIKAFLADIIGTYEVGDTTEDTVLAADLAMDDLDIYDLIIDLEGEFDIEDLDTLVFNEKVHPDNVTIRELIDGVLAKL